jgi:hypothetical protein
MHALFLGQRIKFTGDSRINDPMCAGIQYIPEYVSETGFIDRTIIVKWCGDYRKDSFDFIHIKSYYKVLKAMLL